MTRKATRSISKKLINLRTKAFGLRDENALRATRPRESIGLGSFSPARSVIAQRLANLSRGFFVVLRLSRHGASLVHPGWVSSYRRLARRRTAGVCDVFRDAYRHRLSHQPGFQYR